MVLGMKAKINVEIRIRRFKISNSSFLHDGDAWWTGTDPGIFFSRGKAFIHEKKNIQTTIAHESTDEIQKEGGSRQCTSTTISLPLIKADPDDYDFSPLTFLIHTLPHSSLIHTLTPTSENDASPPMSPIHSPHKSSSPHLSTIATKSAERMREDQSILRKNLFGKVYERSRKRMSNEAEAEAETSKEKGREFSKPNKD